MENQHNKDLDGSWRNTRNAAGKLNFSPKYVRARREQTDEASALTAQLEDSQFQQHLYHCRWAAAERKGCDFKAQLEEVCSKHKYSTAQAEGTIKDLKEQLEQARSNDSKAHEDEIHKLKFELNEAAVGRINAVNRLILADKIMARLNLRLDEKQKRNPAEELRPGDDELQLLLLKTQKDLEEQTAKHREEQDALCCQIQELRAKLCTTEAQRDQTQLKVLDLEEEVKKIKASERALQEENTRMEAEVRRAEEEKASLQRTLQNREEEWTQRENAMTARLNELQSTVEKMSEDH